jgi:hypothetical protein
VCIENYARMPHEVGTMKYTANMTASIAITTPTGDSGVCLAGSFRDLKQYIPLRRTNRRRARPHSSFRSRRQPEKGLAEEAIIIKRIVDCCGSIREDCERVDSAIVVTGHSFRSGQLKNRLAAVMRMTRPLGGSLAQD